MINIRQKMVALSLTCIMSIGMAYVIKERQVNETKAYVGIGYLASKKGVSAEKCAVLGVVGVWESAVQSTAWGLAFGGVAGAIAGATVGL